MGWMGVAVGTLTGAGVAGIGVCAARWWAGGAGACGTATVGCP